MEPAASFRRYRAPQEDGQTLIDPPRSALAGVVARNRQRLADASYDVQGRSLAELSADARGRLIHDALAYTRQYRDVPLMQGARHGESSTGSREQGESLLPAPIILSGHQPQLFHPGVWYKNFLLGRLAGEVAGVGVHLLIDSDLCRGAAIRVPTGTPEQPRVETVPFDQPAAEIPYEERSIRDPATLASFAERVAATIKPLVEGPMVQSLWPLVMARSRQQNNLGLCLAQGRHALEATWRNDTLELPQSAVCKLPEFAWFVAHLLAHLPRFHAAHNAALAEYRRAHRLRNRAQPVPDLSRSDDWLEAPFWVWTADDPRRQPLFARQRDGRVDISDLGPWTYSLSLSDDAEAAAAVDQLLGLAERGIKIRTRALATTLFARLVLGDLFLHGIGGAKYDQVTNGMARAFFGFDLPEFATVSATLRLPTERPTPDARHGELHAPVQRQLRELLFHPERFLADGGSLPTDEMSRAANIAAQKQRWVQTVKTPQNARERHLAIAAANRALAPYVTELRRQWERRLAEQDAWRRAAAVLESREYSFCLFPRSHFERLLLDEAAPGP